MNLKKNYIKDYGGNQIVKFTRTNLIEMRIKIINELLNNELKDMCIRTWRSDDSIKDFLIDRYDVGNETSSAYCYK